MTAKKTPLETRVEELEASLEVAKTQAEEAREGQVRALADLENFRRRQSESQAGWSQAAVTSFLKPIMPNLLELSLGATHSKDETAVKTINKFFEDLSKQGLQQITPEAGEIVNADLHEVLLAGEGEPGTIVQCLEPGWQFQDQVITPAKVSAAPQ